MQTKRNEAVFHERRASAYDCTIVELFVKALENTMKNTNPYKKKSNFNLTSKFDSCLAMLFQGRKEPIYLRLGLASEIGIIAEGNRVVGRKFVLGVGTEIVPAVVTLACHKYKEPKVTDTGS